MKSILSQCGSVKVAYQYYDAMDYSDLSVEGRVNSQFLVTKQLPALTACLTCLDYFQAYHSVVHVSHDQSKGG